MRERARRMHFGLPLEGRDRAGRRSAGAASRRAPRATPKSRPRSASCIPTNFPRSSQSQWCAACPSISNGWPKRPPSRSADVNPRLRRMLKRPAPPSAHALLARRTRACAAGGRAGSARAGRRRSGSPRACSAPDAIEVRYQIAPGYYLYRDKFKFAVQPATRRARRARAPAGRAQEGRVLRRSRDLSRRAAHPRCRCATRAPAPRRSSRLRRAAPTPACATCRTSRRRSSRSRRRRGGAVRPRPCRSATLRASAQRVVAGRRLAAPAADDSAVARLFQGGFGAAHPRASSASACCSRSRRACCR